MNHEVQADCGSGYLLLVLLILQLASLRNLATTYPYEQRLKTKANHNFDFFTCPIKVSLMEPN
ncbi:MAG: hypothetical protein IPK77_10870 [Cellvibrio sp.]|jgi:hypothetical protein|nr:hypothetical protein [Cellvibrio sp.]